MNTTFAQHVGQRIKQRREELKLKQADITRSCKISKSFLSEVENGKRCIGFAKLYELSIVLKRKAHWFGEGWKP